MSDQLVRRHRIKLARDAFKFSVAHMTVFPDGRKERMHGHNYFIELEVEVRDIRFAHIVEFAAVRTAITELCREWREVLLLAEHNPFFELVRDTDIEIEFRLCGERYVLPRADVLLLPIDNISVEALAVHVADRLFERLHDQLPARIIEGIEVTINESPGQGASCYRPWGTE